jgi:hypothetical protein
MARLRLHTLGLLTSGSLRIDFCLPPQRLHRETGRVPRAAG